MTGPEYSSARESALLTYHHAWLYAKIACAIPLAEPAPSAHSIRAAV
jgi:hypothetical protein